LEKEKQEKEKKDRRYTFVAPTSLMDEYEKAAKAAGYNSRSDAIRAAIQNHINHIRRRKT